MLDFDRPYCLIHADGRTRYAAGKIRRSKLLADVPRPAELPVISMVPYTQLRERGYVLHDADEPIISLATARYEDVSLDEIAAAADGFSLSAPSEPRFDHSDEEFADVVGRVVADEIQRGEGSNFLLSSKCRVRLPEFSAVAANVIFSRLVRKEPGAYMVFCFFDGKRYFVGASPERHITLDRRGVTMNPVCGTLPKSALRERSDLVDFLTDPKEINELFQVVDEELKMMSRICADGGVVRGPFLKEMSAVIHTEYVLEGRTTMDNIDAFRESMFAATMIGSPLENAARIIHKYEKDSRRYYSSALVVMGLDETGEEYLDSAITIRTMEIDPTGQAVIQAGASLVRDSVPEKECREIRAKAEGLLTALTSPAAPAPVLDRFMDDEVTSILRGRNTHLSRFWTERQAPAVPTASSPSVLLIDNEDQFTHMLVHILEHIGCRTRVLSHDDPDISLSGTDLVLIGPGPGDPTNLGDPKMRRVHGLVQDLLDSRARFIAVCLGHQILCQRLGMSVTVIDPPLQGVQMPIDLFGRQERVGFYNTFFARAPMATPPDLEIAARPDGLVIALRSETFSSFQFHVESVLTTNALPILQDAVDRLVR